MITNVEDVDNVQETENNEQTNDEDQEVRTTQSHFYMLNHMDTT
jgi:hypothetical protein